MLVVFRNFFQPRGALLKIFTDYNQFLLQKVFPLVGTLKEFFNPYHIGLTYKLL